MKRPLLILCCLLVVTGLSAQSRKLCIDDDWEFRLDQNREWRHIDLPHDWSVETEASRALGGECVGPFNKAAVGTTQTGWLVGGTGWYQKQLTLTEAQRDKQIVLYFEGAYNHATVYVNGQQAGFNPYGYNSFRVDITSLLKPVGQENTILVKVENEGNNTRWYAGSGIYRHVWLMTLPKTHIDEWGTAVLVDNEALISSQWKEARLTVRTHICNEQQKAEKGRVQVTLTDPQGRQVARGSVKYQVAAGGETRPVLQLTVKNPDLWSPEHPALYRATIVVGKDKISRKVGIRSLQFSAKKGFELNGVPTLLQGGCVHHDNGLLGAAQWDKAELRKVELLKAQGYNALRGSHNMQSEHLLDVCDSLGMMFLDECFDQWYRKKNPDDYHQYFAERHITDLKVMVERDINHPSIIMWGIGNEIPGRTEEAGMAAAKEMRDTVHALDPTRPVTAAICGWDEGDAWNAKGRGWEVQDTRAFESLDVGGYNYKYDVYEHDHGTHPDRIICGLESFPKRCSENWNLVEQKPYVIGDFVWTAMDYLGEAGIGSAQFDKHVPFFEPWPWFNGWCGDIDLIGQRKPQSYYRDVVWHRAPITMAVEPPHTAEAISDWGWQLEQLSWTWPEYADTTAEMLVNVYSRAPRVRLYLNDELIAERATTPTYWVGIRVPYRQGILRAVNVEDGKETDSFELVTTGKPAGLRLTADSGHYDHSGRDLAYVTIELVDSEGRVITSNSSEKISIEVSGAGTLLASGTASPNDMASFRSTTPTLFEGRALAIVRVGKQNGPIIVKVKSNKFEKTLSL